MIGYHLPDADQHAPRPHDLLWITDPAALSVTCPLPPWATAAWLARAPLVMRRELVSDPDYIPVGLRGTHRSQRAKAYLARQAVARCVTPEQLVSGAAWHRHSQSRLCAFPAFKALATLAPSLLASGLCWGPTGSVGFALASGLPVLRLESDLDLIVRACKPLSTAQTALLLALSAASICRIDIQIETGHGAFSLSEWTNGHRRVLLKTDHGPLLTEDPWRQIA
ncbi:malonate decarboxylase holo-ACP synthase [Paraherbaspirillum soli]|uniref:Malonate decarboxylase holo-ACP synthase n=1 Tax=Paraherbaspirillum soli TaxID=631222 RepID=A0ABW0MDI8_9BURK